MSRRFWLCRTVRFLAFLAVAASTMAVPAASASVAPKAPSKVSQNQVAGLSTGAPMIAAGYEHTCVLDAGSVHCWGNNDSGQLGLGDTDARGDDDGEMGAALPAVDLGVGVTVTAISAGRYHSCALLSSGGVKCWGNNSSGQLGLGDSESRGDDDGEMGAALPAVDLGVGVTVAAISAGGSHTCALLSSGAVKCWGESGDGQLGLGDRLDRGDADGEMGGLLSAVDLGVGVTVTAISVGEEHSCALLSTNDLKCWGNNDYGQLGLGDTEYRGDGPNEMGATLPVADLDSGVKTISAGGIHTCALLLSGAVKCWGNSDYGQLGLGDTNYRGDGSSGMGADLLAVDLGTGVKAVTISVGQYHSCALLSLGAVKCWGANDYGQLGLGDTVQRGDLTFGPMGSNLPAVELGAENSVTAISAGEYHSCALLTSGAVKCWGGNGQGQLGLGDTATRGNDVNEMGSNLPVVELGSNVTVSAIAVGRNHSCALLSSGAVKCWGKNNEGQLGLGDKQGRGDGANEMGEALPAVDLGGGVTATAISAGGSHTCALLSSSAVKCWGGNGSGQLGLGDIASRGDDANEMGTYLPAVELGVGVTATTISTGVSHTCALLSSGAVKCWGSNFVGRLGLGDTNYRGDGANEMGDALPAINLGIGVTATTISTGASHTCALLSSGSVKCWGSNFAGHLGMGDKDDRGDGANEMGDALPTVNLGVDVTATALSAGQLHSCALLWSGDVKCWGYNYYAQLGLGDTATRGDDASDMGDALSAVDLGAGATAISVSMGVNHSCALLLSGGVKCWGHNFYGQLGLGSNLSYGGPVTQMGDSLRVVFTTQAVADVAVSKSNGVSSLVSGSSTTYKIRVTNTGPMAVVGATLTDVDVAGLTATAVTCSSVSMNVCATAPSIAELQGGVVLPLLEDGRFFEIEVAADVDAASGLVTNIATVESPNGEIDVDNSNNSASDSDTVTTPEPTTDPSGPPLNNVPASSNPITPLPLQSPTLPATGWPTGMYVFWAIVALTIGATLRRRLGPGKLR